MKKSIKILLIILVVIEIISTYFMYKSGNNKNIILDKVELKDILNTDRIAIMTDEDGSGTYKEYTGTTWPSPNYVLNSNETTCINEKGDKVDNVLSYNSSTNKLELLSGETTYCTIYFDKTLNLEQFCSDQTNMGTCITNKKSTIGRVENMTSTLTGGMYRYQGTDNVNNYICFGTTDKSECTSGGDTYGDGIDKYMYRIIGVTQTGELALIKETGVKYNSSVTFEWNDKYQITAEECGVDDSKCSWKDSTIYKRLNGVSSGDNIFLHNDYYLDFYPSWVNLISNHTWKYGRYGTGGYNADSAYEIESAFTDIVQAKIGLQYQHDYLYAYPGGNPGSPSIAKTAWIHYQKDGYNKEKNSYEALIDRSVFRSDQAFTPYITYDGIIGQGTLKNESYVRPVFYLKNNVAFKSGIGSKNDPYIIDEVSLGQFCDEQTNMGTCITNKKSTIEKVENMTSTLTGGMYRYQGTDNVNNYICFGTTNKTQCTSGGDTYGDGIDKYMYRIIGVTQTGELALIKETALKENTSTYTFQWHNKYLTSDCGEDGSKCMWKDSIIYQRLNGISSGTTTGAYGDTNIFINSKYYDYLSNNTWLSKISSHDWKYGVTTSNGNYIGEVIYYEENAFTDYIPAKIGLQYIHDYYYSYPDNYSQYISRFDDIKSSWIYFKNDIYNANLSSEFLLSQYIYRNGGLSSRNYIAPWNILQTQIVNYGYYVDNTNGAIRPVFYLSPSVKISNATGSKTDPFLITN